MKFRQAGLAAALGMVTLAGCAERILDADAPIPRAPLRVIHATPGLGALDVELGGSPVIRGVTFGNTSPLVMVPVGARQLVVRVNNAVIGTVAGSLTADHINSIVVSAGQPQLSAVVEPDTGSANASRANIRMVVVASSDQTPPTQIEARLTRSGANDTTQHFGFDATVARYGTLMYFDPGEFTVEIVAQGTDAPVLAKQVFQVAAGQRRAMVMSRGPDGRYGIEIVVEH